MDNKNISNWLHINIALYWNEIKGRKREDREYKGKVHLLAKVVDLLIFFYKWFYLIPTDF